MIFLDKFLGNLKRRNDNDFVDRMNYYYTPMLLGFFALTLSAKQYAGQPIQCWVPAQFTGAWEQYSEFYCFVKNTYFVPFTEDLPVGPFQETQRENLEIGYYQWVPFVLALQGFMFFIPIMIWRLFNWQSGLAIKGLITSACDVGNIDDEVRSKSTNVVARHIQESLAVQRDYRGKSVLKYVAYGQHSGVYVTSLYLFIKILFVVNAIGQIFLLNSFLGPKYTLWGVDILRDLISGRSWEESGHFPRVTMCDFKVRVLGNLQNHSIQCVLMINMFNEKIFLFLWWWFVVVAVVTIINTIYWAVVSAGRNIQREFVEHYLRVYAALQSEDQIDDVPQTRGAVNRFMEKNLRPDGVLLLRLIAANAGDLVTTSLIGALWTLAKEKHPSPPAPPSETGEKPPFHEIIEPGFVESLPEEKVPLTGYQQLPQK